MQIIVQKFGGTSVATPDGREKAAAKIIQAKNEGMSVVVVVSAMGRQGEPYATDTLIGLAKGIEPAVAPREMDLLIACGEIISTIVMAQTLEKLGHPAVALTGGQAGILTDNHFGEAQIQGINPDNILQHLGEGKIVVVAGFQGITAVGDITTLGRGGSDTTATALGAALDAEMVEIYTDVDGVMAADPRIVPEAKILRELSYQEICEMANQGAKVVHPRAVAIARDKKVPVKVKSTFSEDGGTLISNGQASRVITGIAHQAGLGRVLVKAKSGSLEPAEEVKVFKLMAEAGISVDMNAISGGQVSFVVKQELLGQAGDYLLAQGFQVELVPHCCKISLIGVGMTESTGTMMRVVEALHHGHIKLLQTVDSEITISCLVPEEQMANAIKVLYREFGL
ncbi:aspartate kinase [Hydrogenispora ethanolica]|uniref:Aspartokinase n=1 Tax=Hydrogenispora ethanolica TaxID=1082276 RepID=A0A4V2QCX0_HYDET|nr:aspartate kinase [Hydrogenispora ethanolica]TCL62007.1 aspartate kinase [Hydrogenispora ethanolica]